MRTLDDHTDRGDALDVLITGFAELLAEDVGIELGIAQGATEVGQALARCRFQSRSVPSMIALPV